MEAFVTSFDGTVLTLPAILEWTFSYGLGSPCDSFEVVCIWDPGSEKKLAGAVEFTATHEGKRVFTGRVDEYACIRDAQGSRLELSGRGMQALLLDNEALPMEYQTATVADILRDHVKPYGITTAGNIGLGAVAGFQVSSGRSEWNVVRDFACYHGGIVPRFDREGRLVLSGWSEERKTLGEGLAITELTYAQKRYGVVSQILVRDKTRGVTETVNNTAFQAQGGQCRRVVTTAGRSTAIAMRYSGQFQMRASKAEETQCILCVPELFLVWPGEEIVLNRPGFEGNGNYRVAETVSGVNGDGAFTRITLGPTDILI